MDESAEIGIFGGTGIYDSGLLKKPKEIIIDTPYGKPSDSITIGEFNGRKIAFLPRLLDFTKSRKGSFSEEGRVIHISVADPFCPELQQVILDVASEQQIEIHKDATYVCIEGPRFSTKAESKFYKSTGADIIGMTLVPECQLAREAQICYASISTVTDYDVWAEKPVTAKEVIETLSKNVELTKKLLTVLIDKIPTSKSCSCEKALEEAEF